MRRASFFRGSELPRLLLLVAVLAVGWPLACRRSTAPEPAEAPGQRLAAEVPPLPPPERSKPFLAIEDKTPKVLFRETTAFATLFARAREASAAELSAKGLDDVPYAELAQRPGRYRGLPIHLEGTAFAVYVQDEIPTQVVPSGRYYEAHVYSSSSRFPYILVFEEAPKDLPAGSKVFARVAFDGYFFKLLRYEAGDGQRFAPMLVGRLTTRPAPETGPGPPPLPRSWKDVPWPALLLGLVVLYGLFRLGLVLRRTIAPRRPIPRPSRPADEINPQALADFLNQDPADADGSPHGLDNGHNGHD